MYCECCYVCLPDSMNPFLKQSGPCTFCNKVLHLLEFVYSASFESARVVKYKVLVTSEDHLVFDIVDSALVTYQLNGIYTVTLSLTSLDSRICA